MKPVKSFFPLSVWLLRISVVLFAITRYFEIIKTFDFGEILFYLAAIQIIFSALLFIGGFLSKQTMTVVSALVIVLASIYHIVTVATAGFGLEMAVLMLYGAVGLYFLTAGNQQ